MEMVFPAMATTEQISCRGAYRLDMSYIIGVSPILFITIHHFIIDAQFFEVFPTSSTNAQKSPQQEGK